MKILIVLLISSLIAFILFVDFFKTVKKVGSTAEEDAQYLRKLMEKSLDFSLNKIHNEIISAAKKGEGSVLVSIKNMDERLKIKILAKYKQLECDVSHNTEHIQIKWTK